MTYYSFQLKCATPTNLAEIFLQWQESISSPAVANDCSFNSIINITSNIILIQGSKLGEKAELEASEIYISLKKIFAVDITTHKLDWLATTIENLANYPPLYKELLH
ncbi:hypothetical protein Clacol_004517 [Clathrus columnatus]|uniref:Uncharacterized protein n=1 Tax=Clathrus columnatus TaxID=1419009 RepID=A0AAV5A6N4_9AGAM|nr:hypothetical protein Clacol_004517 [Clathrus columnatus]